MSRSSLALLCLSCFLPCAQGKAALPAPAQNAAAPSSPGPTPQIFAPGVISGPGNDGSPTFSPDGHTLFSRAAPVTGRSSLSRIKSRASGRHRWSPRFLVSGPNPLPQCPRMAHISSSRRFAVQRQARYQNSGVWTEREQDGECPSDCRIRSTSAAPCGSRVSLRTAHSISRTSARTAASVFSPPNIEMEPMRQPSRFLSAMASTSTSIRRSHRMGLSWSSAAPDG